MIKDNNIWKIFYILSISAVVLFVLHLYISYYNITKRHYEESQYYAEIISRSIDSDFLKKEMILRILGESFFKDNLHKDRAKAQKLLDTLLRDNSYLISLGLADANGNVLISSSNVKLQNNLNFLESEVTAEGFKEALSSENMVISRAYYFDVVKEWIIPLRKAIRDSYGNVLGVVVAGIKNSKNSNYLDELKLSKDKVLIISKDYDAKKNIYILYYSARTDIPNSKLYVPPISTEIINNVKEKLIEKDNNLLKKLKEAKEVVSVELEDIFGEDKIAGITYNKKYKLWISVEGQKQKVWDEFYDIFLINISIFMFSYIVFIILFRTINASEERKNKELIYQAQHDTLTNLPNRTYMYENMKEWKKNHLHKYYVLYLDLDNFKNINDKFGHTLGDKILVEVAQRLERFFTTKDMLIRQGGDEFIVLKEGISEEELEREVEDLIALVSKIYHIENREFRVGVSVGIAQYPRDAKTIEELLSLSDTAMYEAKKRKNSYCLFSQQMQYNSGVKAEIEHELRGALENNELWMVYQPQINADGTFHGVEALVRWENKKLGLVGPDKFIAVAEETGLMRELGEFIIKSAIRDIKKIKKDLGLFFQLSINISVVQIMEADFLPQLLSIIEKENFNRTCLTLEITESLSIENMDDVLPLLYDIQEYNIKISLDDFGTGYSSLSILRDLPIDELKIDKSFIDKILHDESEKSLVESIINIGKTFNMKILAEGVESLEQIKVLKEAKCDIFQGFYHSKPLIKDDLIKYIKKENYDRR
jgi:diguanylate cyclase (GGDEF)-like protein